VGLEYGGTLPVSAINVGLAASIGGLSAELAVVTAGLTSVELAAAGSVEVAFNEPNIPAIFATIEASNNPLEVAANVSAGSVTGVDVAADIGVELAFVEAQLAVAAAVTSTLGVGLESGSIAGFSYAGRAQGQGTKLEAATANGCGRRAASDQIQAVVIVSESFASWGAFSSGVHTNAPNAPPAAGTERLSYLGELGGGAWNTGVADLIKRLRLFVLNLEGQKSYLEASLELALGLNPPDVDALVSVGLDIVADFGVDGLIDNLVNVDADFDLATDSINLKISAIVDLITGLEAQLSAGGLSFWTYSGPISGLGSELRAALVDGLPNGSGPDAIAYGLVLFGEAPAMSVFGNIFKVS